MKILSNAAYEDLLNTISTANHSKKMWMEEASKARSEPSVNIVTKVRIEQNVFDALAKELPKPCVPKSELEAGVLLGVQMVLERIRQGWVV